MATVLEIPREADGATAVEYALMAGLVAVVIATSVGLLGGAVSDAFANFLAEMGWG